MVRGRTGTKLALFFKRRQKTSGKLLICLVCPPCYPRSVSHRPLTEHIPSLSPVSGFLLQICNALAVHTFVAPPICLSVSASSDLRPRVRVSIDLLGGTMMIRKPCSSRVATSTVGLTPVAQGTPLALQMARILSSAASTSGCVELPRNPIDTDRSPGPAQMAPMPLI